MDSDFLSLPGARYVGSGQSDAVVVGEPVAWINNSLTAWLNGLQEVTRCCWVPFSVLCVPLTWRASE